MAQASQTRVQIMTRPPAPRRARPAWLSWNWLGVLPFFLFVFAFQFYPSLSVVVRSFLSETNAFTFDNINALNNEIILRSYGNTILISLITATWGGVVGFMVAWAVTIGGLPHWVRTAVLSFSGVASNFAGVPLAFAFVATIGQRGVLTQALKPVGIDLYGGEFTLYGFWGLCLAYTYFQIPLMVLIMTPALDGLRREWREAAQNLGATPAQYWRLVALPVLMPSILGALALLFANAFGTHATAFALVGGGGGQTLVVTLMVGAQFTTDTFANPGLGNALALGMIIVIGVTIFIYSFFRRRAERWMRR